MWCRKVTNFSTVGSPSLCPYDLSPLHADKVCLDGQKSGEFMCETERDIRSIIYYVFIMDPFPFHETGASEGVKTSF